MVINSAIQLTCLDDLKKYGKLIMDNGVKINKSKVAKELNVDRRTVNKYLKGYEKTYNRKRKSKLDYLSDIILELLSSPTQRFFYVSNLYNYLVDVYKLKFPEITFRHFIKKNKEFDDYFKRSTRPKNDSPSMMFETPPGQQAQIDWKESQKIILKNNEEVNINIFVYILSYSRFRVYFLSIDKTRPILLDFLTRAFEITGGVPKEIITDNMATVMDKARTNNYKGIINAEFEDYAKEMGFAVKPCVAATPQTKGKVESPMRILDELHAYSGTLTLEELAQKLEEINNRENYRLHKEYAKIPVDSLQNEKNSLSALPPNEIRNRFKIQRIKAKVSNRCTIRINNANYSVPQKCFCEEVEYSIIDSRIYIYFNSTLIRTHNVSNNLINYNEDDYKEIMRLYSCFEKNDDETINKIAKRNLEELGKITKWNTKENINK